MQFYVVDIYTHLRHHVTNQYRYFVIEATGLIKITIDVLLLFRVMLYVCYKDYTNNYRA